MREREREEETQAEEEAGWIHAREPNVGLHPGTPGSCPELKADTQALSHPGVPSHLEILNRHCLCLCVL